VPIRAHRLVDHATDTHDSDGLEDHIFKHCISSSPVSCSCPTCRVFQRRVTTGSSASSKSTARAWGNSRGEVRTAALSTAPLRGYLLIGKPQRVVEYPGSAGRYKTKIVEGDRPRDTRSSPSRGLRASTYNI
jgi:hypothetical protein